jgi:hypothetical protein
LTHVVMLVANDVSLCPPSRRPERTPSAVTHLWASTCWAGIEQANRGGRPVRGLRLGRRVPVDRQATGIDYRAWATSRVLCGGPASLVSEEE